MRRTIGVILGFIAMGAVGGAVTALLSLSLVWLGLTGMSRSFLFGSPLLIIAVIGAACGMVVMPVLGLLTIGRIGFWRSAVELTLGAVLGANVAAATLWNLDSDVLVVGAFVGALAAAAIIRLRPRYQTVRLAIAWALIGIGVAVGVVALVNLYNVDRQPRDWLAAFGSFGAVVFLSGLYLLRRGRPRPA